MPVGLGILGVVKVGVGGGLGGGVEQVELRRRAVGGARPASDLGVGVGVEGVPVKDLARWCVELPATE